MSVDDIVKLFDAITKLLNVLIWPAIILFILIRFGRDLRDFFSSLGELSLKGAGFEASLKRKQAEVVAALSAAAASKPDGDKTRESVATEAMIAADVVADFVTPRTIRRASRSTVLWVDDNPNNNSYERQALEALGVSFVLAISTDEALKKISRQRFDAIISDMGRPPDSRAGYTLLDKLRSNGDQTPFIIYASSRDPEHVAESRRHGAIGCTNNANELFEMVLSALGRTA
ncbi:MAG: response regulator [Microcystis aeruginosa Ma_MB_F_20061100_S19]|uniref:Hybrid sensory kinase in two-component regulatory system with RcsB and YojN n=3 Tax=Microcystis aeruginosa TaxID=1126 RepID=S3J6N2_MICAE|nr:response regulator [Microcystis aeruginosa]NCR99234.1 response regulator [Microcystis aeruginosa L311-01]NCS23441.1 response regulator [Microcystis aeruginosa BS13-02]OCY15355.1 MAG: histidine kinase [Microcystis aeruginosa CACIAM 03]TRU10538.1 MAG: response regulator [Microcystis aeruginosa Ma_MB_F_20061100_S19D]TRU14629.1 MAG: response regulator [Microcystis aeruginosa Ma_MB_F_20061100_S19]TRU25720.1 MAG: response regulator [Microcystis aeruginosa Ma_QC_B_20070730_S2]